MHNELDLKKREFQGKSKTKDFNSIVVGVLGENNILDYVNLKTGDELLANLNFNSKTTFILDLQKDTYDSDKLYQKFPYIINSREAYLFSSEFLVIPPLLVKNKELFAKIDILAKMVIDNTVIALDIDLKWYCLLNFHKEHNILDIQFSV